MIIAQSSVKVFKAIKERIFICLKGCKERLLSIAGREVMTKSIVQAIPTYTMGLLAFLDYLLNEIQSLIFKFWWC